MIGAFSFNTTAGLRFEAGAAARLGDIAGARLGPRVLVVTDAGVRRLGLADAALASLAEAAEVVVFDAVEADPSLATVGAAVAAGRGVTGVLGFGGGSPMDVAKIAALLLGSGEDIDGAWGVGNAKGRGCRWRWCRPRRGPGPR